METGPRLRVGRYPAAIVVSALLALLAVGGAGYAIVAPRLSHPSAKVPDAAPPHGPLVYELKLSSSAWRGGIAPSPDPAGSVTVGYGAGSLDVHIAQPGGGMGCRFAGPALQQYVADFQFKTDPGSDFELNWEIRGSAGNEQTEVDLNVQVAHETMTLFLSPFQGDAEALAGPVGLPGAESGKTVEVSVSVSGNTIAIYVDGRRAGTAKESTSTGAASPSLYVEGKSGTLHILSLRYYSLS